LNRVEEGGLSSLDFQKEGSFLSLNRSSSRPTIHIKSAIGVKNPKNITLNTIGLIILPSNNPKCIQSLLSGSSNSALITVTKKKVTANIKKMQTATIELSLSKIPPTANIPAKKKPNFRFVGSSTSDNFNIGKFLLKFYI